MWQRLESATIDVTTADIVSCSPASIQDPVYEPAGDLIQILIHSWPVHDL